MKRRIFSLTTLGAMAALIAVPFARGESTRELVSLGNTAFQNGEYEQALDHYEKASVDFPESASLHFNRGTVLYKQEDYEKAEDAFKSAASRSKEAGLSSRAKFNMGNCAFRRAQRQRDSDLKQAIEHCQEAISFYQEARDFDRGYKEAAENIEIVRLFVKVLLDEQKKKQELQEQQDQEEENLVTKLKELIKRQQELIGSNTDLAERKPDPIDVATEQMWIDGVNELSEQQTTLRADTGTVLQEVRQTESQLRQQAQAASQAPAPAPGAPPGQDPPQPDPEQVAQMERFAGKLQEAAGHVSDAITNEQTALDRLAAGAQDLALAGQEAAVVDLVEAVKALSDENQDQQQQQGGDGEKGDQEEEQEQEQDQEQQDGEQEENKDQEQKEGEEQNEKKDQQQKEGEAEQEEQATRARTEKADDILDEEKKNQKERPRVIPGRGQPVDRDW